MPLSICCSCSLTQWDSLFIGSIVVIEMKVSCVSEGWIAWLLEPSMMLLMVWSPPCLLAIWLPVWKSYWVLNCYPGRPSPIIPYVLLSILNPLIDWAILDGMLFLVLDYSQYIWFFDGKFSIAPKDFENPCLEPVFLGRTLSFLVASLFYLLRSIVATWTELFFADFMIDLFTTFTFIYIFLSKS